MTISENNLFYDQIVPGFSKALAPQMQARLPSGAMSANLGFMSKNDFEATVNGAQYQVAQISPATTTDVNPVPSDLTSPSGTLSPMVADNGTANNGIRGKATETKERIDSAGRPTEGDVILNGLKTVRGIFDRQIAHINELEKYSSVTNVQELIKAQAEIAKFSVLTDVTSKLAGKFTQTTDTLLKG